MLFYCGGGLLFSYLNAKVFCLVASISRESSFTLESVKMQDIPFLLLVTALGNRLIIIGYVEFRECDNELATQLIKHFLHLLL